MIRFIRSLFIDSSDSFFPSLHQDECVRIIVEDAVSKRSSYSGRLSPPQRAPPPPPPPPPEDFDMFKKNRREKNISKQEKRPSTEIKRSSGSNLLDELRNELVKRKGRKTPRRPPKHEGESVYDEDISDLPKEVGMNTKLMKILQQRRSNLRRIQSQKTLSDDQTFLAKCDEKILQKKKSEEEKQNAITVHDKVKKFEGMMKKCRN